MEREAAANDQSALESPAEVYRLHLNQNISGLRSWKRKRILGTFCLDKPPVEVAAPEKTEPSRRSLCDLYLQRAGKSSEESWFEEALGLGQLKSLFEILLDPPGTR